MKIKILGMLGAALLCSCATKHVQLPDLEPVKTSVTAAAGTTKQAQTKISQAQAAASVAQNKAKSAQQSILKLEQELQENKDALVLANGIAADVDSLSNELLNVQAALNESQTQLVQTQTNLGEASQRANQAEKDLKSKQALIDRAAKEDAKYHSLKFTVCSLAAGATALVMGFLLFQFWAVLAPLGGIGIGIALGGGIGLPVIVFTYLMFKL